MSLRRGAVLGAIALTVAAAAPPAPEPSDYRTQDYRAPTPATLSGARVISTSQARALWQAHAAVFIDVLPQPPRPAGLPPGTIWQPQPRRDIPGSVWLPDVGYGALAAPMQAYFARNLRTVSNGAHDRTLVFYCLAQCWHSWNAAKRAVALGYTAVAWYPGGTDAWQSAGLPVQLRQPEERPNLTE